MRIRAYADLHLYYNKDDMDRYNAEELHDLKENLLNDPPDLLVFAGDLCHMSYKADDIRFTNIIKFITDVISICKIKKVPFRIIQGTSTHDGKIVSIIKDIYKKEPLVGAFTNVAYEDFKGLTIRYLPEPYYASYEEFKRLTFSKKADITFFHGTIDGVIPMLKGHDNITNLPKAVIMKKEDFLANTRLFSAGGHIHRHIKIDNKIFYINSLTTHNFSDINNTKGYMEFYIDDNKNWEYKYIENHKAPKYLDYTIDNIEMKLKEDLKKILGNIMLMIDKKDNVRFTLKGEMTVEGISNVQYITSIMKKYNVKIITKYTEVQVDENEEVITDYYVDPSISIVDKIKKLSEENGLTLTEDEIKKFISK